MQRILNTLGKFCRPTLAFMHKILHFLDFDLSEDIQSVFSWSALASPRLEQSSALQAEVHALLEDLTQQLGSPGPLDDGYLWDMAIEVTEDSQRVTVCLDLTGSQALHECMASWTQS